MKKYVLISRLFILIGAFLLNDMHAQELSKVIVFSKTEGYRHQSIEKGVESIIDLGKENHFLVQATEDAEELIPMLKNCKAVIFLSTTGDVLNDEQQEKFKEFINNGGGFVGVHAAADTEYKWPWYGKMVGAYFESHPKQQEAIIEIINNKHLSTYFLEDKWTKFDEWYNYKDISLNIKVLMNLDEKSYSGGENGEDHPIAWYHEYEGGKVFYTGLGHTKESYSDTTFLKHLLGGIQYAMGLDKENRKKEVLPKNEWIQLFNGKDLNDWIVKIKGYPLNENYNNTFRVVNGLLQVSYDQYDSFNKTYGHIFYKTPFSSYKLKLQYRFIGEQANGGEGWAEKNSGVMVHSQLPNSMELNQDFPVSIEIQLLGGLNEGDRRPTGNLCTPGTHVEMDGELFTNHCVNSSSETFYGEQWVNLEVLVIKDSIITHKINGKEVLTYSKPQIGGEYNTLKEKKGELLKGGYISLQSESHPIEFRNIELLKLDY